VGAAVVGAGALAALGIPGRSTGPEAEVEPALAA
jgi:hypothetical protein